MKFETVQTIAFAVLISCSSCAKISHLASLKTSSTQPATAEFHVLKTWQVGGEGRWDYLTVDPDARRLYISRTDYVLVLNTDDGTVAGQVRHTPGVHGIALVPSLGRGFTSNGNEGTLSVFDLKDLRTIGKVKAGKKPDAIIYDPASKQIFAFNGKSNDVSAVDAAVAVDLTSESDSRSLALGGKPEFATADGQGNVYVNLEDKSEVVRIDSRQLKITARWPVAPGEEPSGMAIDPVHRRLFIGCHNQMMVVMDADNGKVIATPPIGRGVDANTFDPGLSLAFSSNGDGTLTIVHEIDPDHFVVDQSVATREGARTMALDPMTHQIYLATAAFGPAPETSPDQPHPRPSIAPESFVILVIGK